MIDVIGRICLLCKSAPDLENVCENRKKVKKPLYKSFFLWYNICVVQFRTKYADLTGSGYSSKGETPSPVL